MTTQEANHEYDMLKGNLNRMFTTKDSIEVENQYLWCEKRLRRLYLYHKERTEHLCE